MTRLTEARARGQRSRLVSSTGRDESVHNRTPSFIEVFDPPPFGHSYWEMERAGEDRRDGWQAARPALPAPGQPGLKNVSTKGSALEGLLMVTDEIVQPAEDDFDRKLLKLVVVVMNPVVASDHPKLPMSVPDTLKV